MFNFDSNSYLAHLIYCADNEPDDEPIDSDKIDEDTDVDEYEEYDLF